MLEAESPRADSHVSLADNLIFGKILSTTSSSKELRSFLGLFLILAMHCQSNMSVSVLYCGAIMSIINNDSVISVLDPWMDI